MKNGLAVSKEFGNKHFQYCEMTFFVLDIIFSYYEIKFNIDSDPTQLDFKTIFPDDD